MRKQLGIILSVVMLIAAFQLVRHDDWRAPLSVDAKAHLAPIKANLGDGAEPMKPDPSTRRKILENYGKLPLAFEENRGQFDPRARFISRGAGYSLFLTTDEAVLSVPGGKANNKEPRTNRSNQVHHSQVTDDLFGSASKQQISNLNLVMKLVGSDPHATVSGLDEIPTKSNYLMGNDPKKWQTNLPNYAKVKYAGVYPGIDLIYYGNQGRLEYDFVVAPGADPDNIRFSVAADHTSATAHRAVPVRITAHGDLIVKTDSGEIRLHKPIAYQTNGSADKDYVETQYVLRREQSQISLALAPYDRSRPLVIDPVLSYSTYLGPYGAVNAIAVDASGNAYVTGGNDRTGFPTTPGAFQTTCTGSCSNNGAAFVSKLNSSGSALIYSTYLSGTDGSYGNSITVDSAGDAYVTGSTSSTDFPVTTGAFQTVCHPCAGDNTNAFVTKLNPDGSALVYSTFLGGSVTDWGSGIALDASDNAYVTGGTRSSDFPVTPGSFQPTYDSPGSAFVTKLNAQGTALIYSTYLGGSGGGAQIVVNSAGNAYVVGGTQSPTFPSTPGAFATSCKTCGPGEDSAGHPLQVAFVTEFNTSGSALVYSTFLGGSDCDIPQGLALDSSGNTYVTGYTYSNDFPVTADAFQTTCKSGTCGGKLSDVFLTKLNSTGSSLLYSTYIGGSGYDGGGGVVVDAAGDAYVVGQTISTDFPVTAGAFQSQCDNCNLTNYSGDAFVLEMNPSGSALLYSTYLGGSGEDSGMAIAMDTSGNIYPAGWAFSTDFPTTVGAFQTTASAGGGGGFVAKFATGSTAATDFSLSPATGSDCPTGGNCSTSMSITAGQTATYSLQVAPVSGFNGTVTLSCSGSPSPSTCSISPNSVSPNGTSDSPFTVTVTNTSSVAAAPVLRPFDTIRPRALPIGLLVLVLVSAPMLFARLTSPASRPGHLLTPALVLLLICVAYCGGCSGLNSGHTQTQTQPQPVNATLTITGTSGSLTHTLDLSLTIDP
jgi:Beta-propeller repeat